MMPTAQFDSSRALRPPRQFAITAPYVSLRSQHKSSPGLASNNCRLVQTDVRIGRSGGEVGLSRYFRFTGQLVRSRDTTGGHQSGWPLRARDVKQRHALGATRRRGRIVHARVALPIKWPRWTSCSPRWIEPRPRPREASLASREWRALRLARRRCRTRRTGSHPTPSAPARRSEQRARRG